ncbi:MAG: hypothetical protein ACE5HZ_02005 [Fidelibacterota bacterium]
MALTSREKNLLRQLFSPESVTKLVEMFPDTTPSEWETLYARITGSSQASDGLILYVDGASDPATGMAGIGGVIYETGKGAKKGKELFTFRRISGRLPTTKPNTGLLFRVWKRPGT